MKSILFLFTALLYTLVSKGQVDALWLRYPAISPDGSTIAFGYKGDIYTVSALGGKATALTIHEAHDEMPVWSHDGKSLAFASNRAGNFDVFISPSKGGTPCKNYLQ